MFEMLNLLVSCYMSFVLRNITTFIMHILLPQYMGKRLGSIDSMELFSTPSVFPLVFVKLQNLITIPNRWNEIKISLGFCTCLFLIKKLMKFWKILTCGRRHDGNFNDINLRNFSTCKKWNSFRSNIGKKEGTSANKTIILTKKSCLIIFFW